MKIDHGELGAINFNNMIPVTPANYQEIPLNEVPDDMSDICIIKKSIKMVK